MGERGPQPKANPEECFAYWYNGGERRTFQQVADQFGISYNTVRNYSDDGSWRERADEIDTETRRQLDKRLSVANARALERELQLLLAIEAKFAQRLVPKRPDGSPNPDEITPGDVGIAELIAAVKTRLQIGAGIVDPLAQGGDQRVKSLEEIEAELTALDMAEIEKEAA